ncbi:MAG: transglutaminase-like domain-containing protein [Myxococcota bacterium]
MSLAACGSVFARYPTLDRPSSLVRETAQGLTAGLGSPREKARAIFHFVRDEIQFGFTPYFDGATPNDTLALRLGHCNPQSALFASLLRAAGVPATQHFVDISNEIIADLFPPYAAPPSRITHSYTEVELDGESLDVDGYILDPTFHRSALALLSDEDRTIGYGAHAEGVVTWDGRVSSMSQLADPGMVLADHGTFEDPAEFYDSDAYRQRLGAIGGFFYRAFALDPINARIHAIRDA